MGCVRKLLPIFLKYTLSNLYRTGLVKKMVTKGKCDFFSASHRRGQRHSHRSFGPRGQRHQRVQRSLLHARYQTWRPCTSRQNQVNTIQCQLSLARWLIIICSILLIILFKERTCLNFVCLIKLKIFFQCFRVLLSDVSKKNLVIEFYYIRSSEAQIAFKLRKPVCCVVQEAYR